MTPPETCHGTHTGTMTDGIIDQYMPAIIQGLEFQRTHNFWKLSKLKEINIPKVQILIEIT